MKNTRVIKGITKGYTAGEKELPVKIGSEVTQIAHSLKDGVELVYWFVIKRGESWEDIDARKLPGFGPSYPHPEVSHISLEDVQYYFNKVKFNSFEDFIKN
jgi:hypothetical protein